MLCFVGIQYLLISCDDPKNQDYIFKVEQTVYAPDHKHVALNVNFGFGGSIWGSAANAVYIGRTVPSFKSYMWTHYTPFDFLYSRNDTIELRWIDSKNLSVISKERPYQALGVTKDGIAIKLETAK